MYEVYKIKRPKSALSSLPLKFYVKTVEDGDVKKNKGTPIAYTIKDLQLISDEVMRAPSENQVVEEVGDSTRSSKKKKEEEEAEEAQEEEATEEEPAEAKRSTPKAKPPKKKAKAPAADDPLIGQPIVGKFVSHTDKELKVKGTIVESKKRKKNGTATWYYQVKWSTQSKDKYDYNETSWFKKTKIKQMRELN